MAPGPIGFSETPSLNTDEAARAAECIQLGHTRLDIKQIAPSTYLSRAALHGLIVPQPFHETILVAVMLYDL